MAMKQCTCYNREFPTNNDKEKKTTLQHKKRHEYTKELHTDQFKSIWKKVGFAAVILDTTRRGGLPEEAFIYKVKMTAIKVALKEIHKSEDNRLIIHKLSELYAVHKMQKKKKISSY